MHKYSLNIILFLIIVGLSGQYSAFAQTFEDFKKERENELKEFKNSYTKDYEEFARKEREGIEKLKQELAAYWGENNTKVSTNKEWVEYTDDKQTRTDVNFENGTTKIEILLTPEEAKNKALVKNSMRNAVKDMVYNTCGTYEGAGNEKDGGVLNGQLQTLDGKPVSTRNAEIFADEQTNPDNISYQTVVGSDGATRIKVEVNIPLVPDHIRVRANKFKTSIDDHAKRFEMPRPLIYAIIETESTFNPKARSYVPAYGLMQIVPKFAGRDAFNYLYKKDTIITDEYLYHPENNIELGTAYFRLLMTHYFKNITDAKCRLLCSIAAYNTGTGNVYKAFKGTGGKTEIFNRINTMAYDELYVHLKENLPYKETRNYIEKVTNKMEQYDSWLGEE